MAVSCAWECWIPKRWKWTSPTLKLHETEKPSMGSREERFAGAVDQQLCP